jgi:deoxyadenosine/deoxycytidine kinase
MIVIGGMIGLGKTTVAELLSKEFGSQVFYEDVENNPILPLFYTASPEEIELKRYPFLLQLYFLHSRFQAIKAALNHPNNIIDRSIYEDWYFAKINFELNRISGMEFSIYERLFDSMMEEIAGMPKKAPDLMIYLSASFETVLHRISLRGRSYELDEGLKSYYHTLWKDYDHWITTHYKASDVLRIDMDHCDVVQSESDRQHVIELVKQKLAEHRR